MAKKPTKCKSYRITTDAPRDVVAGLLGDAWMASRLRRRSPIEEVAGGYRFDIYAGCFDVLIAEANGETVISTDVHRTLVTQDKFFMLIPIEPKQVKVNGYLKGVIGKELSRRLQDAGYRADVEQTIELVGGR
jgi:hypothetical protein